MQAVPPSWCRAKRTVRHVTLPSMARAAAHLSDEPGDVLARHRFDGWNDSVGAHVDFRAADRDGKAPRVLEAR